MNVHGYDHHMEEERHELTLDPIEKLSREVRQLGGELGRDQARGLVDLYYRWQEHRIALRGQIRAAVQGADPGTETVLLDHFASQVESLEKQMVGVLKAWAESSRVGEWSLAQHGIGPVIAAGFLAHIDITRAQTAGAIWRFAGLDPNLVWYSRAQADEMVKAPFQPTYEHVANLAESVGRNADQIWRFATHDAQGNERRPTRANVAAAIARRPYNAKLKTLCWKAGDSFKKQSGNPNSFYGKLYRQRKQYEQERDLKGENAEAAAKSLRDKNVKDKDLKATLESGHLPAGQLDLRAMRWAVKIFLSHWHETAYRAHHGEDPPRPFAIEQLGHAHYIAPPEG